MQKEPWIPGTAAAVMLLTASFILLIGSTVGVLFGLATIASSLAGA